MPTAPSAGASPGPYWNTYKHFLQWRRVKDGAKEGIVARTGYSTRKLPSDEPSAQDKYEVAWYDAEEGAYDFSAPEAMLYPQLKLILTDEFLDENEYIPIIVKHLILPLQKANWSVSKQQHDAFVAEAMEMSKKMREELKQYEKQLDTLAAVTDAEQGQQTRPAKPEKAAKKPKASAAAADTDKPAGQKAKADAATSKKAAAAAADKAKGSAAAAAAAAGPSSSKKAAAAGGKDTNAANKKDKKKQTESSGEAGSSKKAAETKEAAASGSKGRKTAAAAAEEQQQQPRSTKKQKTAAGSGAGASSSRGGVHGVTGRVYPAAITCAAGDRKLGTPEYEGDGFGDTEYPVALIIDEIEIVGSGKGKKKKEVKVLPKWQGYELDPYGWEDKANLAGVEAYLLWDSSDKPDYYTAVSNEDAAQAFCAWSTGLQKKSKKKN